MEVDLEVEPREGRRGGKASETLGRMHIPLVQGENTLDDPGRWNHCVTLYILPCSAGYHSKQLIVCPSQSSLSQDQSCSCDTQNTRVT
jgi:hypothetical protein